MSWKSGVIFARVGGKMRTLFCLLFVVLTAALVQAQQAKPRAIVLFLSDDVGLHDTSAYGCEAAPCPHLNRLAEEGLLFTDAHSTTSVCTPSRFSLLTGKYAWRQKGTGILPGDAKLILPTKEEGSTLPSLMQQAGYRTAAFGKWHLGLGRGEAPIDWNKPIAPGPREVGFDYSFIMAATGDRVPCVYLRNGEVVDADPADPIEVNYDPKFRFEGELLGFEHPELLKPWGRSADKQHDKTIIDGISRIGHMKGGKKALWKDQELADTITEEAVRFIKRHAGEPIFIYFCSNDIHVPRDPHPRYRGKSKLGIRGDATVQMDDNIGTLCRALQDAGYGDDTLFIFTSDNGPVIADGYLDGARIDCRGHMPAHPYSGGKYGLKEGGTRVPFIVHWPAAVKAGRSAALVSQVDLARSLAQLAGADVPEKQLPDSLAQLPALLGQDGTGRSHLVEQAHGTRLALRRGQYKYIPGTTPQLYDLTQDKHEECNIAPRYPELVQDMQQYLDTLRTTPETAMPATE